MGKTGSRRHAFLVLSVLALVAMFVQACSDNKGPAGPTFGADQTGHADTAAQIVVQVAVNPNTIELGRRAGITVLVTNTNGRPLEGRHVQLSTTAGRLDRVDGFTDSFGKFVSFLFADPANTAGGTATVTAFVEGATGAASVTILAAPTIPPTPTLVVIPSTIPRIFGATGETPGTCANVGSFSVQFTVTGGVPPYRFTTTGTIGGVVSSSGLYTAPPLGPVSGGFTQTEQITVLDSTGAFATATVTIICTAT